MKPLILAAVLITVVAPAALAQVGSIYNGADCCGLTPPHRYQQSYQKQQPAYQHEPPGQAMLRGGYQYQQHYIAPRSFGPGSTFEPN